VLDPLGGHKGPAPEACTGFRLLFRLVELAKQQLEQLVEEQPAQQQGPQQQQQQRACDLAAGPLLLLLHLVGLLGADLSARLAVFSEHSGGGQKNKAVQLLTDSPLLPPLLSPPQHP
jgi:hypothetical protein